MLPVPTYAILSAGFSGMAVAVQLLRRLRFSAHVCLINRNHRFGRGLAYGTRSASHLLNVPVGRMNRGHQGAITMVSRRGLLPHSHRVNCTGPSADLRHANDRLVAQLLAEHGLKLDPPRLGLEVDDAYRALREDGLPLARLRYVGPLLKAQLWEATAVPELRDHAARLAALLARRRRSQNGSLG